MRELSAGLRRIGSICLTLALAVPRIVTTGGRASVSVLVG